MVGHVYCKISCKVVEYARFWSLGLRDGLGVRGVYEGKGVMV